MITSNQMAWWSRNNFSCA